MVRIESRSRFVSPLWGQGRCFGRLSSRALMMCAIPPAQPTEGYASQRLLTAFVDSGYGHKILAFRDCISTMPSGPSDRQPRGIANRLRAGDGVLFSPLDHPISINEVHNAMLGVAWGIGSAMLLMLGFRGLFIVSKTFITLWAIFGGQRLGHGNLGDWNGWNPSLPLPIGAWTITHEPWWFLFPTWVSFGVVSALF